jgi:hypothetical protein
MVKPVDPNQETEYVALEDRELPTDQQTVWLLRPLRARELAKLEDNLAEGQPRKKGGHLKFKSGTHVLQTLDKGLSGVRNFGGQDLDLEADVGKAAKQKREDFYSTIPPNIRRELADVITGDAEVEPEEEENLS